MQDCKSDSWALDEMSEKRWRCVETVGDCTKRYDHRQRTRVVPIQYYLTTCSSLRSQPSAAYQHVKQLSTDADGAARRTISRPIAHHALHRAARRVQSAGDSRWLTDDNTWRRPPSKSVVSNKPTTVACCGTRRRWTGRGGNFRNPLFGKKSLRNWGSNLIFEDTRSS